MQITNRNLGGYVLRALRVLKGLRSVDVAEALGLSQSYTSMIERDTKPATEALKRKAGEFYGTSIDLTEAELRILEDITNSYDPKLVMVASRIIEHRCLHQERK